MGELKNPKSVKLVIGVLSSIPESFSIVEKQLEKRFGTIDQKTKYIPFTHTSYYNKAMGEGIKKQLLSFSRLINPEDIVEIKVWTNQLEQKLSEEYAKNNIARVVNLDPGYLSQSKLVLASTKDYSHRIYLNKGIYAEITLYYEKGEYKFWEWTYPDYKTSDYIEFFKSTREIYSSQIG